jgi:hypothetical protein
LVVGLDRSIASWQCGSIGGTTSAAARC